MHHSERNKHAFRQHIKSLIARIKYLDKRIEQDVIHEKPSSYLLEEIYAILWFMAQYDIRAGVDMMQHLEPLSMEVKNDYREILEKIENRVERRNPHAL